MTDAAEARAGWSALPRWARLGIIAFAAIVAALLLVVAIRVATRTPPIPLGTTSSDDLRPGSCLAESDPALDTYTVVSCGDEHPAQVFATVDLVLPGGLATQTDASLTVFADAVCGRYLEYRLFLVPGLDKFAYDSSAIAVPKPDAYAAGDTSALCVIVPADPDGDGQRGTMTGDLYQQMP